MDYSGGDYDLGSGFDGNMGAAFDAGQVSFGNQGGSDSGGGDYDNGPEDGGDYNDHEDGGSSGADFDGGQVSAGNSGGSDSGEDYCNDDHEDDGDDNDPEDDESSGPGFDGNYGAGFDGGQVSAGNSGGSDSGQDYGNDPEDDGNSEYNFSGNDYENSSIQYHGQVNHKSSLTNKTEQSQYKNAYKLGNIYNSGKKLSKQPYHLLTKFQPFVELSTIQLFIHLKGEKEEKMFYHHQRIHNLKKYSDRVNISVNFHYSLNEKWKSALKKATWEINEAAPGLRLFIQNHEDHPYSIKIETNRDNTCYTIGNVTRSKKCTISLDNSWSNKQGTALHQLLHALGFQHEHQRYDSKYFYHKTYSHLSLQDQQQYDARNTIVGLTPFDPFSVMCYSQCQFLQRSDHNIWKTKSTKQRNQFLSQFDKIALNLIYPPCKNMDYNPSDSVHGMWYCGRSVMQNHNYPGQNMTDGRCGPTNGPNCPACRVLINKKLDKNLTSYQWQGRSGNIYCKKYFGKVSKGHDGYCGPNNGPSCPKCSAILE